MPEGPAPRLAGRGPLTRALTLAPDLGPLLGLQREVLARSETESLKEGGSGRGRREERGREGGRGGWGGTGEERGAAARVRRGRAGPPAEGENRARGERSQRSEK